MAEEKARLLVGSYGERSPRDIADFAMAFANAHDGLLTFLSLFDRSTMHDKAGIDPRSAMKYMYSKDGLPGPLVRRVVDNDDRLLVTQISVASPGFWEFLGALNPLVVLNDYLERRHERRKDRNYRDSADERRLELENRRLELENHLLENQVVQERLQMAEALGLYPEDQRLLLERLAISPLAEVDRVANRGLAFPGSALPEVTAMTDESPKTSLAPRIN